MVAAVALGSLLLGGGGSASADATSHLGVSPKHGHARTTFVISWTAEYPAGNGRGRYVIGALHSGACNRGWSSFGRVSKKVVEVGEKVVFRVGPPKAGWCPGVFHGVGHWQKKEGDHWRDIRTGRFAFRVLSR